MNAKRSVLIGNLEESVLVMGSDEGVLIEETTDGLRIRTHLRTGTGGASMDGEGVDQTDRSNTKAPRRW